jgi:soluble lytic murein transglycosylase
MRRAFTIAAIVGLLAAAVAGGWYLTHRRVRWNDARTMPPPLAAAVRAYGKGDAAGGLASVRAFLRRYRAPAWESRARVLAAARLARDAKDRDIPDLLPRDLPETDPLAAHAVYLRARGWLARGDAASAADLAARAAAIPDFPALEEAKLTRARALESGGAWRDALRELSEVPGTTAATEAARIAAAHGDAEDARRRLVEAVVGATADSDVDRAADALAALVPDAGQRVTAAERPRLAERARRWLDDGRPKTAIDILRLVRPAGAPSAATGPEALVEAEALLKLGRAEEMTPLLARVREADPTLADGVRYLEARRAAALGSFVAYRSGLEALARKGVPAWRERALLDLARAGEGVPAAATLEAYRRYRAAASDHADPLALLREAWAAYDLGRRAEADAGFARCLARADAPDGVRATATFWKARISEAAGRAAEARAAYVAVAETFPNHYYGLLAAKRLGRPTPTASTTAASPVDSASLGAAGRWLEAGRVLVTVGLWDEAAPCFRTALRHAGERRLAIAAEAAGDAVDAAALSEAVGIAQEAIGDRDRTPVSACSRTIWRLLYPAPSADAITGAARAAGLAPSVVAAVALQESAFNPLAVSGAGARGLLQVMPAVGAELAASAGLKHFDPADLFDPAINLKLGSLHLADYLRRFKTLPLALAAYNGGPSRVERWSLPSGKDDDERFVERIPIPETRLYVKRVIVGARMYDVAWPGGLGAD